MYVWNETIAGKASKEIGSCLYKHLSNNIPRDASKVILYSNTNDGRDIKITMVLDFFLNESSNSELKSIENRFFVSGDTTVMDVLKLLRKQRNLLKIFIVPTIGTI